MTTTQNEIYKKVKERFRLQGIENPADVIVALEEERDDLAVSNKLYEMDIADRDKMLESKVEDVYADFMRDYKAMREELEGTYEELGELRAERDALKKEQRARAEWELESGTFHCSHCHYPAPTKTVRTGIGTSTLRAYRTNYCPNCGAIMLGN